MESLKKLPFSHLCVHISAVQVNLTSVLVNEIAYISDVLFKHAKGGGVGDHHGCQTCFVLVHLQERATTQSFSKSLRGGLVVHEVSSGVLRNI